MSDTAAATPAETTATTPTGRFCWHELLTNDPAAAAAFYGEVIGWGSSEWGEGETPYQLWMNQDVPIGGMMALPEHLASTGVPPHWLLYVSTPDADACAAKAESLGGTVLEMVDVDQVGRMAVLKDPLDAVFIAYQPSDVTPGHDELAQRTVGGLNPGRKSSNYIQDCTICVSCRCAGPCWTVPRKREERT